MPWTCRCTASPEDGEQTSSKLDTGAALSQIATSAFPCLVLRVPRDPSDRPYDVTIKRPNIQGRSRETKTSNSEARESHRSFSPPPRQRAANRNFFAAQTPGGEGRAGTPFSPRARPQIARDPRDGRVTICCCCRRRFNGTQDVDGARGRITPPCRVSLLGNRTSTRSQARYRMPALVPVRHRDTAQRRWQCMERRRVAVAESLIASKGGGDRISILSTAPRSTMADARAMRCAMR